MDDLADPCWSWPHWKFGLKRDDLFTKLHDQYNTIPSSIQDPEAFHHDVFEVSQIATSTDEFHSLLGERKQLRLRELNESLESAAFEIIANPSLIGTEQWQHAVQLFRTKSLDSLVRYFASYLPEDHSWHKLADSASASDAGSSVDSLAHSHDSFFGDDHYDGPIITDEPLDLDVSTFKGHLPPSPRSMTMCSDSATADCNQVRHQDYVLNTLTPPRTLSYTESERDCFQDSQLDFHDEEESQPSRCESPVTPASDDTDGPAFVNLYKENMTKSLTIVNEPLQEMARPFPVLNVVDSDTPTPKAERQSTSFFDSKSSLPHRRHRSLSPSRPHPLYEHEVELIACHRDPRKLALPAHSTTTGRRNCSPMQRRRRCQGDHATRIRKPVSDALRSRPRGRRQDESRS
ncbi:hypothetical protein B0H63DRAFT_1651 [Podospora didyma]|uniref:Uncharacterized protein n=1 Tax=Podospora didyma TaxID=330526 RepID=A0AAE0U6K4_9PEZI|nr:hypothetical protein B0H63DRAFT_1651 [Podospora didyma]